MQIKEIVLYGPEGKSKRSIKFHLDSINIISGPSKTGKTALINIIEYCLGKMESEIPKSSYFDLVSWYGLLLSFNKDYLFIARRAPSNIKTINNFFIDSGIKETPNYMPRKGNAMRATLLKILNEKLGIVEMLPYGSDDRSFSINIRHALFYSFQDERDIMSKKYLFHDQNNYFVEQDMKKTLPYFLNVMENDDYNIRKKIERLNNRLSDINNIIGEIEAKRQNRAQDIQFFVSQLKYFDLIPNTFEVDDKNNREITEILNEIVSNWKPTNFQMNVPNIKLEDIQKRLRTLRAQLEDKVFEKDTLSTFLNENDSYRQKLDEQKDRLETINLFDDVVHLPHNNKCPFCHNQLKENNVLLEKLEEYLHIVKANIKTVNEEKSVVEEKYDLLVNEIGELYTEISKEETILKELTSNKENQIIYDNNIKISLLLGNIQYWLKHLPIDVDLNTYESEKSYLTDKISKLTDQISMDEYESRLDSAISKINILLNHYAQILDLEHSEDFLRFDINKMTIVSEKQNSSTALYEMGSSENFLGYHLITIFSFHEYFVKNNSPTPRFLFLDQPSQPYFPKEKESETIEDNDLKSLKSIYEFIFKMKKLDHFQIIVTDHADLEMKMFQDSVVCKWTEVDKLIPAEWIESN